MQQLDLLLSFDVTGSMGPCIYTVRKELEKLTAELFEHMADMGISVRVGVIAQADYDAHPYVTRSQPLTANGVEVKDFIRTVPLSTGGWNEGEAYEQALRIANTLDWRADASKAFILVGDDLPHEAGYPGNTAHVDWKEEVKALSARGVAIYAVQCPCLAVERARHFYDALAKAHPGGAHILLTQFFQITELLLALVFYARRDAPALQHQEAQLIKDGRYNRGMELAFNTLLNREDAGRAAGSAEVVDYSAAGAASYARALPARRGAVAHAAGKVPVPPGRFQRLTVDTDISIRDFVEQTGAVFKVGRGFYELTKPEDVSDKKEVVLEELVSGDMFTGTDARELLALPKSGTERVKPSNVPAGFRAFVQSTSYNRKLVGGTLFLYEMA